MVAPLDVRAGRDSDRPFLRDVFRMVALESYPALRELGRMTLGDRLDALWAMYDTSDRRWWIAEQQGRSVGGLWVNLGVHPIEEVPEGIVIAVGVVEASRGQGIARRLLEQARTELAGHGIHSLRLYVAPTNQAAIRLYEALGFRTTMIEMTQKDR